MTVHWIDTDTLKRCKAAIACVRISGHHTDDVIASRIEHIHASYGLNGEVVGTITDNGSNFVKAFSVYSISSFKSSKAAVPEDVEEDKFVFEDLDGLLQVDNGSTEDHTQVQYELPPHERYAVHTLNLVASTDVAKFVIILRIKMCLPKFLCQECTIMEKARFMHTIHWLLVYTQHTNT